MPIRGFCISRALALYEMDDLPSHNCADIVIDEMKLSYQHRSRLVASSAFVATKPFLLVGVAPQSLLHDGIMQLL